jgi:hypothetical protein
MTNNLELWDKVRRVPEEHLKAFKRGGGFTGTAIKPMWSVQRMTEEFGPCGIGWGINEPSFQIVRGHNNEVMVYCHVSVWHKDRANVLFGTGGDKVVTHIKANPQYKTEERWNNDDEAFKKAFTDAVTNALKFLGVGADIHMGLWDGNKYAEEPKETPKAVARSVYDEISKGIKGCVDGGTYDDLKLWYKKKIDVIEAFPPDWATAIMKEFDDAKEALKAKAA